MSLLTQKLTELTAATSLLFTAVNQRKADLEAAIAQVQSNDTQLRGMPAGGTAGQVLMKSSGADYAVVWGDAAGGSGGGGLVSSVAGRIGAIVLTKGDVGLSNVDNTSDLAKPLSTAALTALAGKASTSHAHAVSDITGMSSLGTAADKDVPSSGDAGSSQVVLGSDSRLTDARTPLAHSHAYVDLTGKPTLGTAAALNVAAIGDAGSTEVVKGDDARLADSRAPLAHTHAIADVTNLQSTLDGKAASSHTHVIADVTGLQSALDGKQATLVSATNIKTINGATLLGSGDLVVAGAGNVSTTANQNAAPATPSAGNVSSYARAYANRGMRAIVNSDASEQLMQPFLGKKSYGMVQPVWASTTMTYVGMGSVSTTGTATAATYATTNLFTTMKRVEYLQTAASTTNVAGFRWGAHLFSRQSGFHAVFRVGLATGVATSTHRLFVGLQASTSAPSDVNPSTLVNVIGLGCDAADTQLQLMVNDGSGTAVKVALGASFAKATADRTSAYEVALYCAPGASVIGYEVTDLVTNAVARGTVDSTDLFASTTALCPNCYMSVGGTSSVVGLALMSFYSETEA
jgi:hypothetical protein